MTNPPSGYRGSQAFNQNYLATELVNKSTGSFNLTRHLVNLNGVGKGIGLNLSLVYSQGSQGILGMPTGWQFDVPYVIPNQSLSLHGQSFVIDWRWASATGYQSGLRYENNQGVKYQEVIPPQPLPSGTPGAYASLLTFVDGSHYYFDTLGKLLERDDRFGNYIDYFYTDQFGGVIGNTIEKIVDSYGQTVSFATGAGSHILTLPDSSTVVIVYGPQGVVTITDQVGDVTTFTYTSTGKGNNVINQVAYATGLTTTLTYSDIEGKLAGGESQWFPAVSTRTQQDASGVLNTTRYTFGLLTGGNSFTGANAGYLMSSAVDGLMDSNNAAYLYDVYVQNLDANGAVLGVSALIYNFLHLPVETRLYLVDQGGNATVARLTSLTYDISPNAHARTPNFAQPIEVEHSAWSPAAGTMVSLKRTRMSYDAYGKSRCVSEELYDRTLGKYVAESVTTHDFVAVAWQPGESSEMPFCDQFQDCRSGFVRRTDYVLTPDSRSVATATSTYQANSTSNACTWKRTDLAYDTNGRETLRMLSWASPGSGKPGVQSSTRSTSYCFDQKSHVLSVAVTNALGNVTTRMYREDLPGGPLFSLVNAIGVTFARKCDGLGRVVEATDGVGNVTTRSYRVHSNGGSNSVATQSPTGYVRLVTKDGLGRLVEQADNGAPSSTRGSPATRTVEQVTYDQVGAIATRTDLYGLVTRYTHDSLGRVLTEIDPMGNVKSNTYDDGTLTTRTLLNGVQLALAVRDGAGRVVQRVGYPSDSSVAYALGQVTAYDGFGQTVSSTRSEVDVASGKTVTMLSTTTFDYDPDGRVLTSILKSRSGSTVSRSKTSVYDLLGNQLWFTKSVAYAGEAPETRESAHSAFNSVGELMTTTNALAGIESYTYDAAGRLSSTTDVDGTVVTFKRDGNGNIENMSARDIAITYQRDADGRIVAATEVAAKSMLAYALDGSVDSVTYPDGLTQCFARDAFSRVVMATDASGGVSKISYNAAGQVQSRTHGNDTLTYSYGTAASRKGMLVSQQLSGEAAWSRAFTYDGYFRPHGVVTAATSVKFSVGYQYDSLSRVLGVQVIGPAGTVSYGYSYDGLSQVTSAAATACSGVTATEDYSYDGNGNVVERVAGGQRVAFAYNAIDQIQAEGVVFDARGSVVADAEGNRYSYDAFGRLVRVVTVSKKTVDMSYYWNGLLSARTVGNRTTRYYYSGRWVNAVATSGDGVTNWETYMLEAGSRTGVYSKNAATSYTVVVNGSISDVFGGSTRSTTYGAYGVATSSGSQQGAARFGWKEELTDPDTGLVYLRSRYYHPSLMRFMSYDKFPVDNRYVFGAGDPVNQIDPGGHVSTGVVLADSIGVLIGIASAVAAPFSGGTSLEIGSAVVGGILGAASSATALAASASGNRVAETASWVMAGAGAVADAASLAVNLSAKLGSRAAAAASRGSDELDQVGAGSSRVAADSGGFGAPWSRANTSMKDDNCVFTTLGAMTGRSASSVASTVGREEGLVATADEVGDMMRRTGLSRTGSYRQFYAIDDANEYLSRVSRDDEFAVGLTGTTNGHVVHGYWNSAGSFVLHDAQQGVYVPNATVHASLPIWLWRAPGNRISYILNDVDPNDPMDILAYHFSMLRI